MKYLVLSAAFIALLISGCGTSSREITASNTVSGDSKDQTQHAPMPDAELGKAFEQIAADSKGKVGVYAFEIETGRSAELNSSEQFAMQSVVKLPISMAIMQMVAEGKLKLDDRIVFSKDELVPSRMHSPLRDKNPNGGEMPLQEMIKAAVSVSDGTAADVLQRVAGGADGVQRFIESQGVTDMKVRYTHKEFANTWERQYDNWSTARAAVQLLRALWSQKSEAKPGSEQKELLLLTFMYETPTGPNRLKGMLPPGTPVAHKTGSGQTRDGVTSATNDVGIITMPNGNHIAIAVLVRDSSADEKTREAVIARIAKAVFDKWSAPVGK